MNQLRTNSVPQHIAIIMDGNGRWAKKRGLDRVDGHIAGVESIRKVVREAAKCGVKHLTMYAFSTENWGRPSAEVSALMDLLCKGAINETPELNLMGVKMRFIGNINALSDEVRTSIEKSEKITAQNSGLQLIIAVNYSSRWEIINMVKTIAQQTTDGKLSIDSIDAQTIADNMVTAGIPDPDLLIRTSGELRLSNFLLWQLAYSELYFTDIYWPEFDEKELQKAIKEYSKRERRYGLLTK